MTDEQINIAIAEARGWEFESKTNCWHLKGEGYDTSIPNYCGDLNAWKDVLESVAQDGWMIIITKGRDGWGCLLESGTIKNSDMRQFSGDGQTPEGAIGEAFLRMKGLWK